MVRRSLLLFAVAVLTFSGCGKKEQPAQQEAAAPAQSPVDPATAANVNGTVKFTGTAPKPKKVAMDADAFCKTAHEGGKMFEPVKAGPQGGLQDVYVYVKSGLDPALQFPAPSEPAVLDQEGCWYKPHVSAVQTNQTILVKNSDPVLHNINAQPTKNPGFNFGQPVKGMETKKSFPNPEVMIPVKCDVHPWMRSYIGVQAHPYAAVTGEDGSFSLKGLPPGTYELEAWHESLGTATQSVTVGPNETQSVEFAFKG